MNELKLRTDLLKNEGKIEKVIDSYHCEALDGVAKQQRFQVCYEATDLDTEILLRGSVTGSITLNCGRCVEDFELLFTGVDFTQSYEATIPEIDVEDEIRHAILLHVPMHPICADGCKGLCPHCGINRNTTACGCHQDHLSDPRWDKLKDIYKK